RPCRRHSARARRSAQLSLVGRAPHRDGRLQVRRLAQFLVPRPRPRPPPLLGLDCLAVAGAFNLSPRTSMPTISMPAASVRACRFACFAGLLACAPLLARAAETAPGLRLESTLPTEKTQIRQLAFDGDDATYYESSTNATDKDHFTLKFDPPIVLKSVAVI